MSGHAEDIASEIEKARTERTEWEVYARKREEADRRHRELCERIRHAVNGVLTWLQAAIAQGRSLESDEFIPEWARLWIELGRVLRECDPLMRGKIGDFLCKLRAVEVRPFNTLASLLLLSQEGRPEEVACQLAALHSEPATRRFVELLRWVYDGLTDLAPSPELLPSWVSFADMQTVNGALWNNTFGPPSLGLGASSPVPVAVTENKALVDGQLFGGLDNAEEEHSAGTRAPKCESNPLPPARHSSDFRSVHWFGTDFTFSPTQAACVKVLWREWDNGTPEIGQDTVLSEVEAAGKRLIDVFRDRNSESGYHTAWGKMIVPASTRGSFRLSSPKK
jgi:hypothetical protein